MTCDSYYSVRVEHTVESCISFVAHNSQTAKYNNTTRKEDDDQTILFSLPTLMALLVASSDAFVARASNHASPKRSTCQHLVVDAAMELADSAAASTAPAFMIDSGLMLGGAASFQKSTEIESVLAPITKALDAAKQMLTPDIEAQVVTDVNHVISDFTAFFRPSRSVMKMYSIIRRLLVLMADYIPDHSVNPEELLV